MPSVQSLISLATLASRAAAEETTQETCLALDGTGAVDTNVVQTEIVVASDTVVDKTTTVITTVNDEAADPLRVNGWFTAVYGHVNGTAISDGTNLDFQLSIYGIDTKCTPTALSWNIHQEWNQEDATWAYGPTDCAVGTPEQFLGEESLSDSASGEITASDGFTFELGTVKISSGSDRINTEFETTTSPAENGKLNANFPAFTEFETARSILFTVTCEKDAVDIAAAVKDDVVFCARLFPSTVTAPAPSTN